MIGDGGQTFPGELSQSVTPVNAPTDTPSDRLQLLRLHREKRTLAHPEAEEVLRRLVVSGCCVESS